MWLGRRKERLDSKFIKTNKNVAAWIKYFQVFVPKEHLETHQMSVCTLIILCFLTLMVK